MATLLKRGKIEWGRFLDVEYPRPCKMLPPLPSDEDLLSMKTFPFMEGFQWEFKETPINNEKLLPVVCAFLNGGGGWLVIGVRDVDRCVCGIPECVKDKVIDSFIVRCDNILHQNLIIREDGRPMSHKCIYARVIFNSMRRLIVVRVEPEPETSYSCYDGSRYIRLSASNYRMSTERYFTQNDMNLMIEKISKKIKKESMYTLVQQQTQLEMGAEKISSLESELTTTRQLLFDKILAEKVEAELSRRKRTGFLCGILAMWV